MKSIYQFSTTEHRDFLKADAQAQVDYFKASLRIDGGFDALDFEGNALKGPQELHVTTRLIHSYALAKQAGFRDCDEIIDAGMNALKNWHRDPKYGGYFWSVNGSEPVDDIKLAYGHVFVLLAGSSAKMVGHPEAQALIDDVREVIDAHYWEDSAGRLSDEYSRDWSPFSSYRGMNANMHGVEAFLAAYEATGDEVYIKRAGRILQFFVKEIAPQYGWRIPEHYNENWEVNAEYEGNPMFRPRGTTPGHSFELGRLMVQFWDLCGRPENDDVNCARNLIYQAYEDAKSPNGGFAYTLNLNGEVDKNSRYWWPVTEAIGAFATLIKLDPNEQDLTKYAELWQFSDEVLIDHERGGWYPEINDDNQPVSKQFLGKPDIYHAFQADLIPLTNSVSRLFENLPKIAQ